MSKISIIGTGAYGSALACVLAKNNHDVYMYGIDLQEIEDININRRNSKFFKKEFKYQNIIASNNLQLVLQETKLVIIATPSHAINNVLKNLEQVVQGKVDLINTSKGIEKHNNKPLSEYIKTNFSKLNNLATIVGPSFAQELFDEKFTIINIVGTNEKFLKEVKNIFDNDFLKLQISLNENALQYYAALKNILAIGMGIINYLYDSMNTVSAVFAIGFKEMYYIVKALEVHVKEDIIFEMASLGDTYLTASSIKSRNYCFGKNIAKDGIDNILAQNNTTIEGYTNGKIIKEIIDNYKINIPFFESIYNILYNKKNPKKILDFLQNKGE
ncbi:NAD(P)H-dependent glycerol-3-phosphate dehydrogenase [Mycoplasma phocimorsus]|uniref:Glycerol-3-phosphate dehydrogenase n=1 Tax=Mycoplasma phocimorsus TaxID=3045839 RepID=A0AAJ1PT36_9MOLU|nr:NAD(P)H-dependent glycerol-3-phosphate dehydrogenase [Mycoplasma phocimorsus]MDJ1646014.1 2-dehydropantoate 2-reductase N-terminal domain-containing protein [Mycoplasma phocimorsus]MDJ1646295.1 2-dehydropantoate 2-reductase N-terminal domain-containing protein [Mycoplasma phocimorsus]MDJ1646900.1 2-dehydropantoate 2-reductase N-terminal domain-containing protein [Mycoplasma phocimorsus]MDJ1648433.1 2-dehydropantoate 2-reductase N-terminal domain-containing protein [Mycoplasma phocimorsus]MD